MATLDQVLASVREESTLIASLSAYTRALKAQVDGVLSGANLPAGLQTKIDEIFQAAEANRAAIAAALTENTPIAGTGESQTPSPDVQPTV